MSDKKTYDRLIVREESCRASQAARGGDSLHAKMVDPVVTRPGPDPVRWTRVSTASPPRNPGAGDDASFDD
ncbi:hypothetical protein BRAS3843_1510004 [Bradyrhizobium sp. STM 3843]|nr:hypothetical protein BRAS3843_1510004 [Bradyrhizobium sp. STM 3843]